MKLRLKFLVLIICTIIVPIIIVAGLTYTSINKSITQIETDKGEQNIKNTIKYIDSILYSQRDSISSWLPWTDLYNAVKNTDINWINENVLSSAKENTSSEVLIVLDKDFNVLNASEKTPKEWNGSILKDLSIVKKLDSNNYFASDVVLTSNSAYILAVAKICTNEDTTFKNPNGYLITGRELNNSMIKTGMEIMNADITLKFNNGYMLSTIKEPKITNSKISKVLYKEKMVVKAESTYVNSSGTPLGILHVETTSTSGVHALNTLASYSVILIILILLLSFIILLWLNLKVINPINRITNIIKQKDLNQLVKVVGKDEISNLAREFNGFITTLMDNFKNIKIAVNEVKDLSNGFSIIHNKSNKSMDQITSSIESSTCFLNSNITELRNISASVEEINKSSVEILSTLENLKNDSEKIKYSASNGINSLEKMSNIIKETEVKFNTNFIAINNFTKSVETIHNFAKFIEEISAQSNLLAINASIEAARAGQAGSGFAVVSKEVRKLSIQTKEVVHKMNTIINEILSNAKESDVSTNIVKKQLELTHVISNLISEEITSIISNILSITEFIGDITSKFELQTLFLKDLMNKVEVINDSFEKVNSNFTEINDTTHSQLLTSESLSKKADIMSCTIDTLNKIIKQFKGL